MRASSKGKHCSGAERIVGREAINQVVIELTSRAFAKTPVPEEVVVHVDSLAGCSIGTCRALDVMNMACFCVGNARSAVVKALERCGVSASAAAGAVECLRKGPSPGGAVMRGAVIMDALTGERLERDRERGVRASRFDWSEEALIEIRNLLGSSGLLHFRTREALALATKISHTPGVVAELCWSDDPDYTAGYVASRKTGYLRFPELKERGDPKGGRVIFIAHRNDLDRCAEYLQFEPLLITEIGLCTGPVSVDDFIERLK
jgi:6-carboxyhexanoate--CoA ligase